MDLLWTSSSSAGQYMKKANIILKPSRVSRKRDTGQWLMLPYNTTRHLALLATLKETPVWPSSADDESRLLCPRCDHIKSNFAERLQAYLGCAVFREDGLEPWHWQDHVFDFEGACIYLLLGDHMDVLYPGFACWLVSFLIACRSQSTVVLLQGLESFRASQTVSLACR